MFISFPSFLIISLALVAAAPSPSPNGTRIAISKNSRMVDDNGFVVFSIQDLMDMLMFSSSKYNWTMEAMLQNELQDENLGGNAPAEASFQLVTPGSNSRGRASPVTLTDDLNGALWQGPITVGTPAVTYTVDFDTGSSDLFLAGPTCRSASCNGHTKYNPAASSTSRDLGKTFSLAYGDGSSVTGGQYSEMVTLAGLVATQQTFGVANQYSTGFRKSGFPPDGLMGMAFKAISTYQANPVFQTLISQGSVANRVFAFKLARTGSELYIGGTNSNLYTPPISYAAVTKQGYWQVNMDSVGVDGKTVHGPLSAIIDTGTTLIIGTQSDVRKVYNNIPGAKDATSTVGPGFFTIPCSTTTIVSLSFGGSMFPISPNLFNLGQVNGAGCVGALVGNSIAANGWIIGDVFLQNVYTIFDVGNLQVGFASLKQ